MNKDKQQYIAIEATCFCDVVKKSKELGPLYKIRAWHIKKLKANKIFCVLFELQGKSIKRISNEQLLITIGGKLKEIRESSKISTYDLQQWGFQGYNTIEKGKKIRWNTLIEYADILGVNLFDLIKTL